MHSVGHGRAERNALRNWEAPLVAKGILSLGPQRLARSCRNRSVCLWGLAFQFRSHFAPPAPPASSSRPGPHYAVLTDAPVPRPTHAFHCSSSAPLSIVKQY